MQETPGNSLAPALCKRPPHQIPSLWKQNGGVSSWFWWTSDPTSDAQSCWFDSVCLLDVWRCCRHVLVKLSRLIRVIRTLMWNPGQIFFHHIISMGSVRTLLWQWRRRAAMWVWGSRTGASGGLTSEPEPARGAKHPIQKEAKLWAPVHAADRSDHWSDHWSISWSLATGSSPANDLQQRCWKNTQTFLPCPDRFPLCKKSFKCTQRSTKVNKGPSDLMDLIETTF